MDVRAWFPCPFCHAEIEIAVLCCHLQEEHCFDLKNAVCPICAKDAVPHFTYHHIHLIKVLDTFNKDADAEEKVPEIRVVEPGGEPHTRKGRQGKHNINMQETTSNQLSAFLGNIPSAGLKEEQVSSATFDTKSTNDVEKVTDHEEKQHQAAFVQQLIFSTIF